MRNGIPTRRFEWQANVPSSPVRRLSTHYGGVLGGGSPAVIRRCPVVSRVVGSGRTGRNRARPMERPPTHCRAPLGMLLQSNKTHCKCMGRASKHRTVGQGGGEKCDSRAPPPALHVGRKLDDKWQGLSSDFRSQPGSPNGLAMRQCLHGRRHIGGDRF